MNHSYGTRRGDLVDLSRGLSLLATVLSVNEASPEDTVRIMQREDTLIADPVLKSRVMEHAGYLGLLIRMIDDVSVRHCARTEGELVTAMDDAWRNRLRGGPSLSEDQTAPLAALETSLSALHATLREREGEDAGSSSPSDYSDSETHSSSMETEGEEGDETQEEDDDTEEEEEEEEEPVPPPRRRRR